MPPKKDEKLIGFYADEKLVQQIEGFAETLSGADFKARGRYSRKKPSRGDVCRYAVQFVIERVPLNQFIHFAEEKRAIQYPDRQKVKQQKLELEQSKLL